MMVSRKARKSAALRKAAAQARREASEE